MRVAGWQQSANDTSDLSPLEAKIITFRIVVNSHPGGEEIPAHSYE